MTNKKQGNGDDPGNPEAAQVITRIAEKIAEKTGYENKEFYEELNKAIDPYQKNPPVQPNRK